MLLTLNLPAEHIVLLTDDALVHRMRTGEEAAFTEIYHRYWKKLLLITAQRVHRYEDVQEIVQEIFVSLWTRRERLELRYSLSTYLHAAVKYQVIRHLSRQYEAPIPLEETVIDLSTANDHGYVHIDLDELQAQVAAIVDTLPEKCRLVFRLSREKDYTHRQIARELGISEKTVQSHITLALTRIRSGLGPLCALAVLLELPK